MSIEMIVLVLGVNVICLWCIVGVLLFNFFKTEEQIDRMDNFCKMKLTTLHDIVTENEKKFDTIITAIQKNALYLEAKIDNASSHMAVEHDTLAEHITKAENSIEELRSNTDNLYELINLNSADIYNLTHPDEPIEPKPQILFDGQVVVEDKSTTAEEILATNVTTVTWRPPCLE